MKECDVEVFCTLAWSLVDEADFLAFAFSESVSYAILDAESNMVNTLVALVKPLLDC